MEDSLQHGLLIVFVGFNPSPASLQTGHPYAHRSNRFYRILTEPILLWITTHAYGSRHSQIRWPGYQRACAYDAFRTSRHYRDLAQEADKARTQGYLPPDVSIT